MQNFEVNTVIYSLDKIVDHTKTPDYYTQAFSLKYEEDLLGIYRQKSETKLTLNKNGEEFKNTKFYFQVLDEKNKIVEENVMLKNNKVYMLAYKDDWYIVSKNEKFVKLKLLDPYSEWSSEVFDEYIQTLNFQNELRIGNKVDLFGKEMQLVLPTGKIYETGFEEMSISSTKATRNVILTLCIIGGLIYTMLLDYIINFGF